MLSPNGCSEQTTHPVICLLHTPLDCATTQKASVTWSSANARDVHFGRFSVLIFFTGRYLRLAISHSNTDLLGARSAKVLALQVPGPDFSGTFYDRTFAGGTLRNLDKVLQYLRDQLQALSMINGHV